MTLIEVLLTYRNNVRDYGRHYANNWLSSVVREEILLDVQESVDDKGNFVDGFGNPYCFVSDTVENENVR